MMTTLWDVHTLAEDGPIRHFQQYEDPVLAEHLRAHYAAVLHVPMVVEEIEVPGAAQAPEVSR